jgi:hypothetical protein
MPGIDEAPMSAMISTVMVVGVTPMSVACNFVFAQAADVVLPPVPAAELAAAAAALDWVTTGLDAGVPPWFPAVQAAVATEIATAATTRSGFFRIVTSLLEIAVSHRHRRWWPSPCQTARDQPCGHRARIMFSI